MTGQKRKMKFNNSKTNKRRETDPPPNSSEDTATTSQAAQSERSMLEGLPTELIQQIFLYSANYDLPLVSKALLNQLSDTSMVSSITKTIMRPFESGRIHGHTNEDAEMVCGMFQRRFFSLNLLRDCYYQIQMEDGSALSRPFRKPHHHLVSVSAELREWVSGSAKHKQLPNFKQRFEDFLLGLISSANFFQYYPSRYLRNPWTEDKFQLFEIFSCACAWQGLEDDWMTKSPSALLFRSALNEAVETKSWRATKWLCDISTPVEQEHLRAAIRASTKDLNIFSFLLYKSVVNLSITDPKHADGGKSTMPHRKLDYLDPVLWQRATQMKRAGDERGDIVMDRLKVAAKDQAAYLFYLTHRPGPWPFVPNYENWLKGRRFE